MAAALSRLERVLSPELHEAYRAQLAAVQSVAAAGTPAEALVRLRAHMVEVFAQNYGLTPEVAEALGRIAADGMSDERVDPAAAVAALAEQVALQRALVMTQVAGVLRPYFAAAGKGALEGFRLEPGLVLAPLPLPVASPAPRGPAAPVRRDRPVSYGEFAPQE